MWHTITISEGTNRLYWAFSLGVLLPLVDDEQRFYKACTVLFGNLGPKKRGELLEELTEATIDNWSTTLLEELITTHLRPKLADYCRAHASEYQRFYDSEASFFAAVLAIYEGREVLEQKMVVQALGAMTEKKVFLYTEDVVPTKEDTNVVHIILTPQACRVQLHALSLPERFLRLLKVPSVEGCMRKAPIVEAHHENRLDVKNVGFKQKLLECVLESTLQQILLNLNALAQHVAPPSQGDMNAFLSRKLLDSDQLRPSWGILKIPAKLSPLYVAYAYPTFLLGVLTQTT